MTWADVVLNFSKIINKCLKTEEQKLVWLRNFDWKISMIDGRVTCFHPELHGDAFTVDGAIVLQCGELMDQFINSSNLPISDDAGTKEGIIVS